MENLPNELLEDIFKHLDRKTKLKMFLISKQYNEIMSCSTALMMDVGKNLTINFEKLDWTDDIVRAGDRYLDIQVLLKTNRRYQHLKLVNLYGTTISFYEQKIAKIFETFQYNLKELEIESSRIDFTFLLKASKANFFKELRNLKLFLTCKEYYFTSSNFEINFNVTDFHKFLNRLEKLENLQLDFFCHYNGYRDVFVEDVSAAVEYQLKSLKISRIKINGNFLKYLKLQKHLIKFEILNSIFEDGTTLNDLFEVLMSLGRLKRVNLQIYGITVVTDECLSCYNSSIETLTCIILTHNQRDQREFYLKKFVSHLPNLQKFKFSTEYSNPKSLTWLNQLQNLRELELMDCKPSIINSLHLKQLQYLKFHVGTGDSFKSNLAKQWIQFFQRHPTIKSLHLNGILIDKKFLLRFCKLLGAIETLTVEIADAETAEIIIEFFQKLKFAKLVSLNDAHLDQIEKLFQRSSFNVNRKFRYLECMKVN